MMSTVRKEVLGLVCEIQALLGEGKSADESACNALDELKTLLPGSSTAPSNDTLRNHHQEAKSLFASEYYASFAEHLIDSFSPDWLQGGASGRRLHQSFFDFFLQGDPECALIALSHAVSATRQGLKAYHCISILESLFKQNGLRRIFSSYCCLCTPDKNNGSSARATSDNERMLVQKSGPLVSAVASLPDMVAAKLTSREDSDFFYPQNYVPFIGGEIVSALRTVYARLREEQSCSVSVVSAVLGKLAMIGHGKLLWQSVLKELEAVCVSDFLWQRVLQRTVSSVPDRCLEQVTTPLIVVASSYRTVKAVLGDLPAVRERLSYVLTHKLLLVRYTDEPRMLRNIIGYLACLESLRSTFMAAFTKLLSAWSDGSSLRHRPLEQTIYICKAIMVFVGYLTLDGGWVTNDLKDTVMQSLLGGMSSYLDSSVVEIRQAGMVVAESLSGLVHSDEKRMEFEVERNELVDGLRELVLIAGSEDRQSAHYQDEGDTGKQPPNNDSKNASQNVAGKSGLTAAEKQTEASEALDSDDDDELTPYDSNPTSSKPVKRPYYLAQCMDGLLKSDDPEWFEQCLQHAEALIRSHTEVSEMAVELCKVLLNLEDQYSLPEFVLLRHKAMVALVMSCPETTAQYLTREFYERNYNVRQRLDILDVLSSAARELSRPLLSPDTIHVRDAPSGEVCKTGPDKMDQMGMVAARIESKTRRFCKGATRPAPTPVPSRFAKVSGWFFYPLMSQFDKRESCLDLLGSDHILLQRLLSTLGVVMFCASNSPNISPMARALTQFTWCFRYHAQQGVRRAVLGAVIMTIVAVPPFLLASDLCPEVADLRGWLEEEVMRHDSDPECCSLAAQILIALQSKLKQEMKETNDN